MATKKSQRIAIWVIAAVMLIGTVGSFFVIILQNDNAASDQKRLQDAQAEYQSAYTEYEKKTAAQGDELSAKYYDEFSGYQSRVAAFNKDEVTELKTEDLKAGDGEELKADSAFTAYYIGWNPAGEVFDGSIADGKLKPPFTVQPGGVIKGWSEGVVGMKVGGVRELTIPADKAYGEQGSGDKIAPNTPLKFVIMVIPTPEQIAQPEIPEVLRQYYGL